MKRLSLPLWLEIAGAILLALALSNIATVVFFRIGGDQRLTRFAVDFHTQRIAGSLAVALKAPATLRPELTRALSGPGFRLSFDNAPLVGGTMTRDSAFEHRIAAGLGPSSPSDIRAHMMTDAEREAMPPPPPRRVAPDDAPPTPREVFADLLLSVPAGEGVWINARVGVRPGRAAAWPAWPMFYAGGAMIGTLLVASLWMGRRVAYPLQRLADAAGHLRRGEVRSAVPETGPTPVREAARAFNAMAERVTTTLKSQRALMAAVAHDLRTPIAALRFRAELVADHEARARLVQTIDEMQAMTEAVLDAVRIDGSGEPARSVDVATLAESLVADMAEVGGDVTYVSDVSLVCMCRAGEVRRALRNLIENALRYGRCARVSAEAIDGALGAIHVDDEGPGIPPADLERVFEPFARLEESRSAETGGYGLGLAIARLIARGHDGDVVLVNRTGGGLRATLRLPLSAGGGRV